MSSIPLPALNVRPPQQPDPIEQMGRLMQMKSMLQNQELQKQNLQAGELDIQQKQQALKDQQAMTAAMHEWDGKDLNTLVPLVVKSGGSANAVMGLKAKILEQQSKLSEMAKNDAITGETNFKNLQTRNDLALGALKTADGVPDEQLSQHLLATAQDLAQKGIIDPPHLQAAQQVAQIAQQDPAKARQALSLFEKGLMSNSQMMKQAADDAELAAKKAQLPGQVAESAIKQSQADFAKKTGVPAGVPVENMEMADYLAKNPGKGPKDFAAWKGSIAPTVRFNLEAGAAGGAGSPQTPEGKTDWGAVARKFGMTAPALDQAAEKYFQTGNLPPIGRGISGAGLQRAIMNRTAELHPEGQLAANSAEFKANAESLKKLQTNFDQVSAFESTAKKNIDLLQETAKKIPDLGSRFANVPVRMISSSMLGTDQMAAFKTALNTAQTEAAKVLNSSNATGVLSDSARHELQDIVDGNMPYSAMVASLNTLKQDMGNRHQSYADQIADIKKRLGGKPGGGAKQGDPMGIR